MSGVLGFFLNRNLKVSVEHLVEKRARRREGCW
jgi:hypothetical protein